MSTYEVTFTTDGDPNPHVSVIETVSEERAKHAVCMTAFDLGYAVTIISVKKVK